MFPPFQRYCRCSAASAASASRRRGDVITARHCMLHGTLSVCVCTLLRTRRSGATLPPPVLRPPPPPAPSSPRRRPPPPPHAVDPPPPRYFPLHYCLTLHINSSLKVEDTPQHSMTWGPHAALPSTYRRPRKGGSVAVRWSCAISHGSESVVSMSCRHAVLDRPPGSESWPAAGRQLSHST